MIIIGIWFQFVTADTNTDPLQGIAATVQSWVQNFRDGVEKGISEALAGAQNFLQSLQDQFGQTRDKLTSSYSSDTNSASQVKACVQTGEEKATAVVNSTSTYSNIINVFTVPSAVRAGAADSLLCEPRAFSDQFSCTQCSHKKQAPSA
jgi:hypothetical protein